MKPDTIEQRAERDQRFARAAEALGLRYENGRVLVYTTPCMFWLDVSTCDPNLLLKGITARLYDLAYADGQDNARAQMRAAAGIE